MKGKAHHTEGCLPLQVRSGVRAVPKHTSEGSPPLVGRIPRGTTASSVTTDKVLKQGKEPTATGGTAEGHLYPDLEPTATGSPPTGAGLSPTRGPTQDPDRESTPHWWLITALGVRGLLYHALMAEYVVRAIRANGDESHIPEPLRRWQ